MTLRERGRQDIIYKWEICMKSALNSYATNGKGVGERDVQTAG